MARAFVIASSHKLSRASTPVTAAPLTISAWCRPAAVNVTQTVAAVTQNAAAGKYFALGITSAAKPFWEASGAVTDDALHQTSCVAAAWTHLLAVETSTTRRDVYKDGVQNTTPNTTSITPASLNAVSVGAIVRPTPISFFGGDIAEVAMWNVALTQPEITMLALGVSPLLVRPASLVWYSPIMGEASPEQDAKNATGLTLTGTPAAAAHPRVLDSHGPILVPKRAAAGHIITLGQPSETDLAQAISRAKLRTLGQPAETELAQPIRAVKTRLLGQASETDAVQPVARSKTRNMAQASETDLPQAIARVKTKAIGQAAETELAQAIARRKLKILGQPSETDLAQPINRSGAPTPIGQASETDTAFTLARLKVKAAGQALEIDTTQPVRRLKVKQLGQPTETDVTQAIHRLRLRTMGQPLEADLAQAIRRLKTRATGIAAELDFAQAIVNVGGAPVVVLIARFDASNARGRSTSVPTAAAFGASASAGVASSRPTSGRFDPPAPEL